jgi:3',5'-nucleoside bisphosphate phosphatase
MYVDLHCHTYASDGKTSPTELIKKAHKMGFSVIAKTDHDSIDLTAEFLKAGKKYGIQTISGIEISSRYKKKSVHIIGLNINHTNKALISYTKSRNIARKKRGLKMASKLGSLGWHIKKSEFNRKNVVRPHIALSVINHSGNKTRLIKEFGSIPDFSTFIRAYIVPGKPCFVPKTFHLKPNLAIRLVHQAGGLAIIGHPKSKTNEFNYTDKYLTEIITKFSFDGLEVYSRDHTKTDIAKLAKLAKKYNLLISAGSDYHGYDDSYPLGASNCGKKVNQKNCQKLLDNIKLDKTN